MLDIVIDALSAVAVLIIIAGLFLKWKEKRPGGAPKPVTRYLLIGGPVLLVAAVAIAVLDPETRKQFAEEFNQGEKSGKEIAGKLLPKVPGTAPAPAQKSAAASPAAGSPAAASPAATSPAAGKPQTETAPAAPKPAGETVAAAEPAPAAGAQRDAAAAPAQKPRRSWTRNQDLRKCLDLEDNAAIIKCAR